MTDSKLRRMRDRATGPATLISEGCKITGLVSGVGDYIISGEIHGDCDIDGTVTVTGNGLWKGLLKAHSVIVAGAVEGDIEAGGSVEVTNTARISGSVTGAAIAVAEGAIVDGVMRTTGNTDPTAFVEKRATEDAD
jgi:cytoskeletal protein CcmA (bactofilin family)